MENVENKILKITFRIMFSVFVLALILTENVNASTITVPDDYTTIQLAVNAAIPGDEVYVKAGTYYENVVIAKALTLRGENRETTIIDASAAGKVVYVTSSNVTITGFTIKNSGKSTTFPEDAGVVLISVSNNLIDDCIITLNGLNGLYFKGASNSTIQNCDISFNEPSSGTDGAYRGAIHLRNSPRTTITGNNIYENNGWGISSRSSSNYVQITENHVFSNTGIGIHLGHSSNCVVDNNIVQNNAYGFHLDATSNCTLENNKIFSNEQGVFVVFHSRGNTIRNNFIRENTVGVGITQSTVSNNRIYHNDFVDNAVQATDVHGKNIWDNGYPSGGNFWKDYTGEDLNNDGIGDTPYIFDNKQDRYPLVQPLFNTPPVITAVFGPVDPVLVDSDIIIDVDYGDNEDNIINVTIDWGDENPPIIYTENISSPFLTGYTYSNPGLYSVDVTVTDEFGEADSETYQYIVVYDPSAGFVTGGGWIISPEGAYIADPGLSGIANFGFVSKYKKGQTIPKGNTEFQFNAGNLNFKSTGYEWLIIADHKAQFKGVGTINNSGNYGLMLSAVDAELTPGAFIDKFRIKIWDKDDGDIVVYDNNISLDDTDEPATEIGGGSIVIHTGKNKSAKIEPENLAEMNISSLLVYPNPFNDRVLFEFYSPESAHARIDLFDATGRLVKTVFNNPVKKGIYYKTEYRAEVNMDGYYIYHMILGEEEFYGKIVHLK